MPELKHFAAEPPGAEAHHLKTGSETYSSAIAEARNYMDWLIGTFAPYLRGRIVEVGIGHGFYAPLLARHGDYFGLDIDEQSVGEARERFPGLGFAACDILDADELRTLLPDGADAIVSINVMEHIEEDAAAMANLVANLRPGGHLLLAVPAMMMLYNDLDRLAGHCRRYSLADLRARLAALPVEVERLRYFNPIGGLGWWVNGLQRHDSLNSDAVNGQIRFFDSYVLPISRGLDPVFRGWFGQSVICIARRT